MKPNMGKCGELYKDGLMKTYIKHIVVLIFLLTGFLCCKDEDPIQPIFPICTNPVNDTSIAETLIIGQWDWNQTYTLLRGQEKPKIETPEKEGEKILTFNADKTVETIINNQPSVAKKYQIAQFRKGENLFIVFTNTSDTVSTTSILRICGDSLVIDNSYNDTGGKELYIKKS